MGIETIERIVRIAAIVVFLALAWLCLGGETLLVAPTPISGFLAHMLMFFFLGAASCLGWVETAPRMVVVVLILAVAFELVQVVLPGRSFSLLDLAGNLIGVALAWVFYKVMLKFKRTIRVQVRR
ncbi:VanZ like family protein [Roseovarius albus]|uniref:VanZ like family protein n=1 Tax=Roseovarius albus TaxID=1247867 RepID=A0A1X6ZRM4_9RHOB|nr:VanZ family protein [Roseovarius albus]SLN59124.1 VanZ like family protein [Roseovarius albus]